MLSSSRRSTEAEDDESVWYMNIVGDMEGLMLDERVDGMRHMDEYCGLNLT